MSTEPTDDRGITREQGYALYGALVAKMRAQACAVYIAAPKECADDIAVTMRKAADELERLSKALKQIASGVCGWDALPETIAREALGMAPEPRPAVPF